MMNENLSFGSRPIIPMAGWHQTWGVADVGVGGVGDVIAYFDMWTPFMAAHLNLWREMNALFEAVPTAKECPAGIFNLDQVRSLSSPTRSFCADLLMTRIYTSDTHQLGIRPRWRMDMSKSSFDRLASAESDLKWLQNSVMDVGGPYKNELVRLVKFWKIDMQFPDAPALSRQQEIIAQIEGAWISLKGVIQLMGYGVGDTIVAAADMTQATVQGLSDVAKATAQGLIATAKELPKTTRWIGIAAVVTAVLVGGGLLVYYLPRRAAPPPAPPPQRRELPA